MDVAEASREVGAFMVRLSEYVEPSYPHHATALRGELVGAKLTNDRWNRIAALLASLGAVPGAPLGPIEHRRRGAALSAVTVAQKMAAATFGNHDPASLVDFALWYGREIEAGFADTEGEQ